MKRSWHRYSFEILLFFVLLAGSFLLVRPLSKQFESVITKFRDDLTNNIETQTGLRLRYESMSPSILQSIQITNFEIYDPSSGSILASIDQISITYNFYNILKGHIGSAIERIELNHGYLSFSLQEDSNILYFLQNIGGDSKKVDILKESNPTVKNNFFKDISDAEIIIRNISLQYIDPIQSLSVFVSFGTVGVIEDDFVFNLETQFRYSNPFNETMEKVSGDITIDGSLHRSLSRGISSVLLHSFDSPLASVSRLSVVTVYNSGIFTLNTVQDLQPVDIQLTWDTQLKRIDARLHCERLLPFKWIKLKNTNPLISNLLESEISGIFHFVKEHNLPVVLEYEIKANIPSSFYGGGTVSSKGFLSGDYFDLQVLNIKGKNIDITGELLFDYKKFIPEGFVSVQKLKLPDGTFFSGDLYFNPSGSGFSCLIPILYVNKTMYSSVDISIQYEGTTIDFSFSAQDSTGKITAQASFIRGSQSFLQGYIALDSISFFDSFALLRGVFSKTTLNGTGKMPFLSSYAMTTEVYFSSDFSDFSFNCPRLVVAPLTSNEEYLLLSAKGNLEEIELFDIQYLGSGIDATGSVFAGFAKTGDILFDASLLVNTIPFDFNGLYSNRVLSVYGDYALAASVLFDVVGGISGSFQTKSFPVFVSNRIFSVSTDVGFTFENSKKWKVSIDSASIEEATGLLPLESTLSFTGYVDPSGVFFPEVTLADGFSVLEGSAGLSVLRNIDFGSRYTIDCSLNSATSDESVLISASISGINEIFLESVFSITSFPFMRLLANQQKEHTITMQGTLSGTLDTLFATIDIEKMVFRLFEFDLETHGSVILEDNKISLFNASGFWNGNSFSSVLGNLDLGVMKAQLVTDWNSVLGSQRIEAGIAIQFDSYSESVVGDNALKKFFIGSGQDRFAVSATVSDLNWGSVSFDHELKASLIHEPGITALYAGKNDSITGYLFEDGTFSLSSAVGNILEFEANGLIQNAIVDIRVSNIYSDLSSLWKITGLDFLSINKGDLKGNLVISGLLNDPDFQGVLDVSNCMFTIPRYLEQSKAPLHFTIIADGKEIQVPTFTIPASQGSLDVNANILFDRWIPVSLVSHIESGLNQAFNIDIDNEYLRASGTVSTNIDILLTDEVLSLKGKVFYEEGFIALVYTGFNKQNMNSVSFNKDLLLDLEFSVGKKVEFRLQPAEITIIRGLIRAERPLLVQADTSSGTFQIKGTAGLRGGEVFYLKRNFYLREGSVFFNENQDLFDPYVTLRAEIRERDAQGDLVRIILSVENQPLSNFSPVLTSDPIRSEVDILELLGQVTRGDVTGDNFLREVIINSSDVLTQLSLFRNTENAVRDFLNLDLFSIRTLVLQNALLGQRLQTNKETPLTIGNYFDNTTVYMGKYLGSAIYADALLHFSYFDARLEQGSENLVPLAGRLLFQPEIGLEVNTPLFLLRWSFSPQNIDTISAADNSVTLSWKFSY